MKEVGSQPIRLPPGKKQRSHRVENAERIIMYAAPVGMGRETFVTVVSSGFSIMQRLWARNRKRRLKGSGTMASTGFSVYFRSFFSTLNTVVLRPIVERTKQNDKKTRNVYGNKTTEPKVERSELLYAIFVITTVHESCLREQITLSTGRNNKYFIYTSDWRRSTDKFSLNAFREHPRSELNFGEKQFTYVYR